VTVAIDHTSDRPVFKQIADHLRSALQRGELEAGGRLPSEQLLSTHLLPDI